MQQHGDRLSAVDASFLAQEGPTSHMHIGGVTLFDGPVPAFEEIAGILRSRLHLVPRYRQRLATPPLGTGRPLWVDDPTFDLGYHLRGSALPRPGSREQLRNLVSQVFSQRLDRSKPLWELWIVEGLDDGRWALIFKNHHALVDGVGGIDLATALLDVDPVARIQPGTGVPWQPRPQPSGAELAARGVRGLVRTGLALAERAVRAAGDPERTLAAGLDALEGVADIAWAGLNPAPDTPLNVDIGPHRRFLTVTSRLDDLRLVKSTFSTTVNDVVLSVVAGALRDWLRGRAVRTEGLELRALVPVSIRAVAQHGHMGNRIAAMRAPLPVYIEDPVLRLQAVKEAMDDLKESKQALGAEVISSVQDFAPPTLLAQASRLQFSTRLFNLLVTNVPGPQVPLYVCGRELCEAFPVAFLPSRHALAIAIVSYNGAVGFGLLADLDAMPDLDVVADGVQRHLAELVRRARQRDGAAATPV
jgi:diacylglycerol O-acyltransferase / wax synthase